MHGKTLKKNTNKQKQHEQPMEKKLVKMCGPQHDDTKGGRAVVN